MRISLVGPGKVPIPPPSRGGVENTLWEYQQELTRLGCEVQLINVSRPIPELAAMINDFNPDFVNVHWEPFYPIHRLLPGRVIAFTTHHCSAGFAAHSFLASVAMSCLFENTLGNTMLATSFWSTNIYIYIYMCIYIYILGWGDG